MIAVVNGARQKKRASASLGCSRHHDRSKEWSQFALGFSSGHVLCPWDTLLCSEQHLYSVLVFAARVVIHAI